MPCVDLRLNLFAFGQHLAGLGTKVGHDPGKARPERAGIHAGARQGAIFDKSGQLGGNAQAAAIHMVGHDKLRILLCWR